MICCKPWLTDSVRVFLRLNHWTQTTSVLRKSFYTRTGSWAEEEKEKEEEEKEKEEEEKEEWLTLAEGRGSGGETLSSHPLCLFVFRPLWMVDMVDSLSPDRLNSSPTQTTSESKNENNQRHHLSIYYSLIWFGNCSQLHLILNRSAYR